MSRSFRSYHEEGISKMKNELAVFVAAMEMDGDQKAHVRKVFVVRDGEEAFELPEAWKQAGLDRAHVPPGPGGAVFEWGTAGPLVIHLAAALICAVLGDVKAMRFRDPVAAWLRTMDCRKGWEIKGSTIIAKVREAEARNRGQAGGGNGAIPWD